jgi:D-tyrosyl-tRNA(Tyr) deacylase
MRVLIQRVKKGSVSIENRIKSQISKGLVVFVGIEENDTPADIEWMTNKIVHLRIFDDDNGVMNRDLIDIDGEILLVSQFTLYASTKKGNRPSYIRAAKPEISIPVYEKFCIELENATKKSIATGEFGADMQVELINDGPVTIWIDSKNKE